MLFYMLISLAAGVIVVVSRILNSKLSETAGLMGSTFFNYLTSVITSLILFFIMKDNITTINSLKTIPVWAYLGGILGAAVVFLSSVVTPKMSAFYVTLLIFIAQLFTGIIIDWLTINAIPYNKIIGGVFVVAGLAYNLHIDYKDSKNN